jgi:hypothetical protein
MIYIYIHRYIEAGAGLSKKSISDIYALYKSLTSKSEALDSFFFVPSHRCCKCCVVLPVALPITILNACYYNYVHVDQCTGNRFDCLSPTVVMSLLRLSSVSYSVRSLIAASISLYRIYNNRLVSIVGLTRVMYLLLGSSLFHMRTSWT